MSLERLLVVVFVCIVFVVIVAVAVPFAQEQVAEAMAPLQQALDAVRTVTP